MEEQPEKEKKKKEKKEKKEKKGEEGDEPVKKEKKKEEPKEEEKKKEVGVEEFAMVDIRIGEIVEAWKVLTLLYSIQSQRNCTARRLMWAMASGTLQREYRNSCPLTK